jgi:hypothetical protein
MINEGTVTGGCLCGEVRYEIWGARRNSFICHCRMCQRASGAPFMALFYMPIENIRLKQGQLQEYQSSRQAVRYFCGKCGSPLFFHRLSTPHQRAICVGSLDDPNNFEVKMHVCLSSAVEWLDVRDTAPRYEEKPVGMTPTLKYDPVSGHTIDRQ